jgi:hypothetical protein
MTDLASMLGDLPPVRGQAPWSDHEYVRGWGVFGLPFDSGHVLALRVFPENDFAPYRTIWHRDPAGRWAIYADAPRLDIACPRYYGPACDLTAFARIGLEWTGPASLRVTMDRPRLEWSLTASETPLLRALNAVSARLPAWTWRPAPLVRARELLARRLLGMGDLRLRGAMPSGHQGTLMPGRMYFVEESSAVLDGLELGHPARVARNPMMGDIALPARGVLAVGGAVWEILDREEYDRTRGATRSGRGAASAKAPAL